MIRVGVIGLGYWGPNIVRNFLKIRDAEVVYGCDLLEKNLVNLAQNFPAIKPTKNYLDILDDKSIDLVSIATPISTHFRLAKEALLAGKHVLLEKPMTKTSQEGRDLIEVAKKQNKILMVGHTFVFSEPVKKVKEIISKNEIGKIYYYDSTRVNLGLLQPDSNVVWDLAPHDLSILSYIFDKKPLSVQAFGTSFINKDVEEIAHIFIKFEDKVTAHINVSWLSPVKIRNIFIGGSKKMIVYDDIEPTEKIRIYDKRVSLKHLRITPFAPAYRSGDILIPNLPQTEALFNELTHLVDCIREEKSPITDGGEGLKVVELLEAIDKALELKKEVLL